ncbi:FMN-binding protein [Rathayibacter sp. CAU 1779]
MKKIIYGLLATITGVVLLFSYRTSLDAVSPAASASGSGGTTNGAGTTGSSNSTGSGTTGSSSGSGSSGSSSSSPSASASASSNGLKDGTFTGASTDTRYGPVQVAVTVSGGTITKVDVPVYPTESFRDQEINRQAVPELVSETLDAQNANIDMISGATFTSEGYLKSLQSALDEAHA